MFRQSLVVLGLAAALNLLISSFSPVRFSFEHVLQQFREPAAVKLYGSATSTCTRRVALVLREKNVPYELIAVDLGKGEHKDPGYVATKQPFGQVPVLVDGDVQLFESRAIARYIAHKYAGRGTPLVPAAGDVVALGRFEQAASIEQANFDAFAGGIASELVFIPARGGKTDHKRVESLIAALSDKLDGYERILSKQAYLAGDMLTLADLFHLPYGTLITQGSLKLGLDLLTSTSRPHVARWWRELSARAAWVAVQGGA